MPASRRPLLLALLGAIAGAARAGPACAAGGYEVGLGISGHLAYEEADRRRAGGLLPDLVRLAAERTGFRLQVRAYPLARLVRMLERRELPVLGLRLWTPQRPEIVPLLVATPLLWVRASHAGRSLDALLADPTVIFGRLSTGTVSAWVDKRLDALPPARVEPSRDPSALLRKLAVGHVHAAFSMPLMQRVMHTESYDWQALRSRSLPEAGQTVGGLQIEASRICAADAKALRAALAGLRDDGSLWRLLQQHLGEQALPAMVWRP